MYSEQIDLGYDIALINWDRSIEDTKYNMNADIWLELQHLFTREIYVMIG